MFKILNEMKSISPCSDQSFFIFFHEYNVFNSTEAAATEMCHFQTYAISIHSTLQTLVRAGSTVCLLNDPSQGAATCSLLVLIVTTRRRYQY